MAHSFLRRLLLCVHGPHSLVSSEDQEGQCHVCSGLTVNCEKTVAMVIYPRSSKTSVATSINITCGRTTIPLVDSTRMLGVIIDSNLSWKEHVDHVCLKVNRKIGALRRSFRQLCPVARRLFYLSIIQPDFDFGSSAFIPNIYSKTLDSTQVSEMPRWLFGVGLSLLPGFKIGLMIPDLNSVGKVPVANDSLKRIASCVDMWRCATVSSKGDIKSGPEDKYNAKTWFTYPHGKWKIGTF